MFGSATKAKKLSRRLADEATRTGQFPMVVLPSTKAAFDLVAACLARDMPVRVVGNPGLVESWNLPDAPTVMTPLSLWSTVKAHAALPFAVVVFEDQLVTIDDSYLRVDVDDRHFMVSPVVVMILMKFRPPTHIGHVCVPRKRQAGGLELTPRAFDLPRVMSQQMVYRVMGEILQPLLACLDDERIAWLARASFTLKQNQNSLRVLIQQLQEMESLVRLCSLRYPDSAVPAGWLGVLRTSRLDLARQVS